MTHVMHNERVRRFSSRACVGRQGSELVEGPVQTRRLPAIWHACGNEGGS